MGFPFTNAQWKELERQALIYKHMVASIPIPVDLLLPPISTSSSNPNNNTLVRYVNGKAEMEGGRCKRTDGKKWRCSRDVAPNQKYCERHMNRGRPRSRKHVEQQQSLFNNNNKKLRYYYNNNNNDHNHNHNSILTPTTSITNNQTHFLGGSSSTTSLPYYQFPYNSSASPPPPPPQYMNLEWMMGTEQQNQEWLRLMQSGMEITEKPEEESFLNNICTTDCTASSSSSLYNDVVSHQTARSFIDAWSKTTTTVDDDNNNNNETTEVGNLTPSSLTLSMGNWVNPLTSDSGVSWVSPLAEVLRQKTTTTSLSDSSNSTSSPTAKPNPEIALF